MTQEQKNRLMDNIVEAMHGVPSDIVECQVGHFYRADPKYGTGIGTRMGLAVNDLPTAVIAE
jgi:catalase